MSAGPIVPMFMQCGVPLNAIRRWRLLLGIWACPLAMPAMRGVESAAPSVLILYSHDQSLPGNVRLEQGFRGELGKRPEGRCCRILAKLS
jgi:hypothetical protein